MSYFLQFSHFKKLNKEYLFLLICFTFLNSVRLTFPHQNTQGLQNSLPLVKHETL